MVGPSRSVRIPLCGKSLEDAKFTLVVNIEQVNLLLILQVVTKFLLIIFIFQCQNIYLKYELVVLFHFKKYLNIFKSFVVNVWFVHSYLGNSKNPKIFKKVGSRNWR